MRVIEQLAQTIQAYKSCKARNNEEWADKHESTIVSIINDLPSGSGIDCGTKIDLDHSNINKVVLLVSFHHMDDMGGYDGWTDHKIIATPSFIGGFDLRITGINKNNIKEYLSDIYSFALDADI